MLHISVTIQPEWEVCVKQGDEVDYSTPIAQVSHEAPQSHVIPLAQTLAFKPEKVFKHLKKNIGDQIFKGDVIAVKDGLFSTKKYIADMDGQLIEVNHHTGEITLEEKSPAVKEAHILSLIKGTISLIQPQALHCKVSKVLVVSLAQPTTERLGGPLIITDNTHAMLLTLPQVQGNIIFTQECTDYVLAKLEALGAPVVISTKPAGTTKTSLITLEKESDLQTIIDFAPTAVYANAAEKTITFYK